MADTANYPDSEAETLEHAKISIRSSYASDGGLLAEAGKILRFMVAVLSELPFALRHYPIEVMRQTGILILSSGVIVWFIMATIGAEVALQGYYLLTQLGAGGYVGLFTSLGDLKGIGVCIYGWIFSAKVGCGLVAELGSMRISEEIDALDVMGMHSRAYLAGTRVLAYLISAPFFFLVGLSLMYVASYAVVIGLFGTVSVGGYNDVFWAFQTPSDIMKVLVWALLTGMVIVIVGCYYGYTASGGPVGVGRNTAKSMVVNLIFVGLIGVTFFQLLFGTSTIVPIAN